MVLINIGGGPYSEYCIECGKETDGGILCNYHAIIFALKFGLSIGSNSVSYHAHCSHHHLD